MKKKHSIIAIALFIAILLAMAYLHRTPKQKEESTLAEITEKIAKVDEGTSAILNTGAKNHMAEDVREPRMLSQEEFRVIGEEYRRLRRLWRALDVSNEHEINGALSRMGYVQLYLPQRPMIGKANARLNVIPHYMFDVKDGEVRIPPNTEKYWGLLQELRELMDKPEQTDEEDTRIRQIAWEIYDMVKTNTPTSVFQMPESKEE